MSYHSSDSCSGRKYSSCPGCNEVTEECQDPKHLGKTKCMLCGGGVADEQARICVNCADLPYRRIREAGLGSPIIYTTERSRSYLL